MNVKNLLSRLNHRVCNQASEGSDLPGGDGVAIPDAIAHDDDLASLEGLDRGDGVVVAAPGTEQGTTVAASAGDAAMAEEVEQAGDGKPLPSTVPMPRFNEVNARRKQAEQALADAQAEIQQLRSGGAPATSADLDTLEEKYAMALMDGNTKEAAGIRRQINQQIEHAAVLRIKQTDVQQRQAEAWDAQVSGLLAENPWLETEEGAPIAEMITDLVEAKMAKGVSQFDALTQVTAQVLKRFAPASAAVLPSSDTRTANSLKRGALASSQQAPFLHGGVGNRATGAVHDVDAITDEQFLKLSDAEKASMRGD